jgi:hemerythrin
MLDEISLLELIDVVVNEHIELNVLIDKLETETDLFEIMNYFAMHSKAEEDIMKHFKFPGIRAHVAEHRYIIKLIGTLSIDPLLLIETKFILAKAVNNHVTNFDYKIFAFLESSGRKPV